MSFGHRKRNCAYSLALICIATAANYSVGQTASSPSAAPPPIVAQSIQAFSAGGTIHQIQLTGSATWHAGSLNDSGSVSLTANADGSGQMQLALGTKGNLTETFGPIGEGRTCQYTGAGGVTSDVDAITCWKPTLWFLPSVSFLPSSTQTALSFLDQGVGPVGSGTYRHIVSQIAFSDLSSSLQDRVASECTTDIGLDPTSLLPSVLAYKVHPDNGSPTQIAIEIRFADYRSINGVQLPFSIKRYVNGSLQLDLTISTASVN